MTMYRGTGLNDHRTFVTKQTLGHSPQKLPFRLELRNHSPDGFSWGYPGSAPAQLALAILADTAGDPIALNLYQRFKDSFTSRWQEESFELRRDQVPAWLQEKGFDAPRIALAQELEALHTLATQALERHAVITDQEAPAQPPDATEAYMRPHQASMNLEDALRAASRPSET